ncbi:MAG: hypothetical protein MJ252_09005 [archaeon]|nr:hypothetical protein [archaeon]
MESKKVKKPKTGLYCNTFFWSMPKVYGIPIAEIINEKKKSGFRYKEIQKSNVHLDYKVKNYMLNLCEMADLSFEAEEASILCMTYLMIKNPSLISKGVQALAIACVLLCSKQFDRYPIPLNLVHDTSRHSFSTPQILECEKEVVTALDFNFFFTDDLVCDRVGLYMESIRDIFYEKDYDSFIKKTHKVIITLMDEDKFFRKVDIDLLALGIIHATFLIVLKKEAKFPWTYKLASFVGGNVEVILKLGKKIARHAIGQDKEHNANKK